MAASGIVMWRLNAWPLSQRATPVAQPVRFAEVTAAAGITFRHNNGASGLKLLPETMGSGAVFFDYNGDGWPDIFFVNGRDWTPSEIRAYESGNGHPRAQHYRHGVAFPYHRHRRPRRAPSTGALYRNNGDGTFRDVTAASGLNREVLGMGAAAGDYNNDGRPDLYVTALGRNYLFRNEGGGKFRETTLAASVQADGWSTSAAWLDYDRDGRLDLFVCRYVKWTPATDRVQSLNGVHKTYSGITPYSPQTALLYRNLGGGRFADVTRQAGINRQKAPPQGAPGRTVEGKSLGVAVTDFNSDGWPDIAVANDTTPNFLFENQKDGTFREVAQEVGIAVDDGGTPRAGMGIDAADLDRSGRESLLFGNFYEQMLGHIKMTVGSSRTSRRTMAWARPAGRR